MLAQTQTPLDLRASLRLKPHWTMLGLASPPPDGYTVRPLSSPLQAGC